MPRVYHRETGFGSTADTAPLTPLDSETTLMGGCDPILDKAAVFTEVVNLPHAAQQNDEEAKLKKHVGTAEKNLKKTVKADGSDLAVSQIASKGELPAEVKEEKTPSFNNEKVKTKRQSPPKPPLAPTLTDRNAISSHSLNVSDPLKISSQSGFMSNGNAATGEIMQKPSSAVLEYRNATRKNVHESDSAVVKTPEATREKLQNHAPASRRQKAPEADTSFMRGHPSKAPQVTREKKEKSPLSEAGPKRYSFKIISPAYHDNDGWRTFDLIDDEEMPSAFDEDDWGVYCEIKYRQQADCGSSKLSRREKRLLWAETQLDREIRESPDLPWAKSRWGRGLRRAMILGIENVEANMRADELGRSRAEVLSPTSPMRLICPSLGSTPVKRTCSDDTFTMSASPAINSTESSPEVVISSQVSLNYDPVHLEALSEFHIPQSLVKHMADRDSDHLSFGEMPFTSSPAAEAVESKVQPIADDEPGLTITNTFNLSTTSLDQIVCPVPFENETQDSKHQVGEDQITPITLQVVQRDNGEIDPLSLCESKDDVVITMAKNVKASSMSIPEEENTPALREPGSSPVTTTAELPYSQIKKQEPKIIPTEPSSLQKRVHPVESEVVFEICDETRQDSNDIEHRLFSILVQSGFPNHAVAPFIKALESRGYVIESTSLTPYRLSGIFKPKSKKHTKLRFLVRMDNNSSVLTNEEIADILFKIVKGPSSETSRWRGMRAASAFFKKAFSSIAKKFRRENRSA